jgi:glycoside/pentoside/hexuronide:cation symporter, GPH family
VTGSAPEPVSLYTRERRRVGPLPLSTRIFQGLGALPDTYKNFAFSTFLLFLYNQVLGVPALLASSAIMVALVVDAITDPVVGSYSDGLRSRLGRRHPLMFGSILPLGASLYLALSPPAGLPDWALFVWLMSFAVATRVSMTFFVVPWNAMFAEFSDDYAERSSIITFRYLIGSIGSVIFIWCTWTFIFPSTPEYTPGHLNPAGYATFAPIVAGLVMVSALLTTWLTVREIPYLRQPSADTGFGWRTTVLDLREALRNRDFLVLFVGLFLSSAIGGTVGALEIYMNTYFWGFRPEDLRWFTVAVLGAFLAFATIPLLQRRFDKHHLLLAAMIFLLLNGLAMVGLRFADVLPANGDPLLLRILVTNEIFRAMAAVTVGIMFASMVADTLDAQELRTGQRQEGVFAAALSFSAKAVSGVGVLTAGVVLDLLIRFPRGVDPAAVAGDTLLRLGLVAGIALPLCYVVPFWMMSRYRITRVAHAEIKRALAARTGGTP